MGVTSGKAFCSETSTSSTLVKMLHKATLPILFLLLSLSLKLTHNSLHQLLLHMVLHLSTTLPTVPLPKIPSQLRSAHQRLKTIVRTLRFHHRNLNMLPNARM